MRGWDDPRMPTRSGLRRRGFPAEAIRDFCLIGVSKGDSIVDVSLLEFCVREELNRTRRASWRCCGRSRSSSRTTPTARSRGWTAATTPRTRPPARARSRSRRELYIERDDFREDPPKEYFRLAPGREVRLRYAYLVKCTEVVKDAPGRSSSCTAPMIRRRAAATPRRAQGQGDAALGVGRARRAR